MTPLEKEVFENLDNERKNGVEHDFDMKPMAYVDQMIDYCGFEAEMCKITAAAAVSKWRAKNSPKPKPVEPETQESSGPDSGSETRYYGMVFKEGGREYTYEHKSIVPVAHGTELVVKARGNEGWSTVTVASGPSPKPSFVCKGAFVPLNKAASDD